jgi:hypothetical protein
LRNNIPLIDDLKNLSGGDKSKYDKYLTYCKNFVNATMLPHPAEQ